MQRLAIDEGRGALRVAGDAAAQLIEGTSRELGPVEQTPLVPVEQRVDSLPAHLLQGGQHAVHL